MKIAVRYYSKYGRTRSIAESIAEGAGVEAVSITDEPELKEHYDMLFLGGAPYANIMAPELKAYADKINFSQVDEIILFTTSNWSRRTVLSLKKIFKSKGIKVSKDYFYAHMTQIKSKKSAAKEFADRIRDKSVEFMRENVR